MRKFVKLNFVSILCFILLITIIISAPIVATKKLKNTSAADTEPSMNVLNIWQIDSFEGGKGSRADYLQNIGNKFAKQNQCYVTVRALTADAARENLQSGNIPELISYGAGTYGLENFICGNNPYYTWCNGSYCFLTLDENADFSDVSATNTVVNGGTDNLAGAAALFSGIDDAVTEKPTGAYVKLINGKFKYLLGTQRDIFRLKTRGVTFSVKPITEFNDLYQNISITTKDSQLKSFAESYIKYLLSESESIKKLGLLSNGYNLYDDELHTLENLNYENKLIAPISGQAKAEIDKAIINCDIKMLKNFLN